MGKRKAGRESLGHPPSFTWDFENRLTQAIVPGSNGGTTTFKYDPFGRRIQKSGPLGTTNYLYDGSGVSEELDTSGTGGPAFEFVGISNTGGAPSFAYFAKGGYLSGLRCRF